MRFLCDQGGQQCWALWAFLAACPCTLFIDIISLFINWANKDACLLAWFFDINFHTRSPLPREAPCEGFEVPTTRGK